ncbi:hypothetical protein PI124_g1251 [Phytophthora idaei]|nr:hypothetical protein PI125_g9547 [Phytophthora idaei]KAG3173583.1 hypothetical protein PI126_g767 [Phytophthora idaei]KAG3254179.1 hypothetical protein PI124_g1251 [Phytophthora idaei]
MGQGLDEDEAIGAARESKNFDVDIAGITEMMGPLCSKEEKGTGEVIALATDRENANEDGDLAEAEEDKNNDEKQEALVVEVPESPPRPRLTRQALQTGAKDAVNALIERLSAVT